MDLVCVKFQVLKILAKDVRGWFNGKSMWVEIVCHKNSTLSELEKRLNEIMGTSHNFEFIKLSPNSWLDEYIRKKTYDKRCSVEKTTNGNVAAVIYPRFDQRR